MNLLRSLRKHGIRNTLGWAWVAFCERYFEWRLGISTGRDAVREFTMEECKHYEPLPYFLIRNVLAKVEGKTLLDYGCGLGRVCFMAAHHRQFREIIGIDINEDLIARARNNRLSYRGRRAPVTLQSADATTWIVPAVVTDIVMFNPFVGRVMEEVQKRIRESLIRTPRTIRIFYAHAFDQPDLFAGCAWLKHVGKVPTGVMAGMSIEIYEGK